MEVVRIRILRIMEDLQDWDDATHRFHPHPSPLPSRERGFCRLFCLVVCARPFPSGLRIKSAMTGTVVSRPRSVFLNKDLQDYDDVLHCFHPHL